MDRSWLADEFVNTTPSQTCMDLRHPWGIIEFLIHSTVAPYQNVQRSAFKDSDGLLIVPVNRTRDDQRARH